MATIDRVGSTLDIGGGNTEKIDGFPSGQIQRVGDEISLTRGSSPMGIFEGTPEGALSMVGDNVGTLKRAPHRGYESGTPINAQREAPDTKQSY